MIISRNARYQKYLRRNTREYPLTLQIPTDYSCVRHPKHRLGARADCLALVLGRGGKKPSWFATSLNATQPDADYDLQYERWISLVLMRGPAIALKKAISGD
jgi:hypothetical protein